MTRPASAHRLRRLGTPLAMVAGTVLMAGCAKNETQSIFTPKGDNARKINDLQLFPMVAACIVGIIVFAFLGFAVYKFKDRGQPIPGQGHGNSVIEIGTVVVSAVLLGVIAVPTTQTIFKLAKTNDCKIVVNVTGQRWWWEYSYPVQAGIPKPIVTSGELVIPTGQCVLLRVMSRDVIHSYWIPALNGKKDAVPGRVQPLRLEADHPGIYDGQCTEFCGLSHANMKMEAVALDAADFATWVTKQTTDAAPTAAKVDTSMDKAAADGFTTFSQCSRCHQVSGRVDADGNPVIARADQNLVPGAAPNLTHLMSRSTFAGATFALLTPDCRANLRTASPEAFGALYLKGVTPECLNRDTLAAWLRDPVALKPMMPAATGLGQGMPNLKLTENAIYQLIAYLETLK